MRVAIASCRVPPEPDQDEPLLLAALSRAGIETSVLPWEDEGAPFAEHDLVVIRSTWTYWNDVEGFLAWVARTGEATRLLNPSRIVTWNAKKTYLTDLEARGVATVPTVFVERGEARRVEDILEERGWDEVVIKPVVSGGSFRTEHFARDQGLGTHKGLGTGEQGTGEQMRAAQDFLDGLTAGSEGRAAMVQQWMPSVQTYGERSLVWIDGVVTHAIRKTPRFHGGFEQVTGDVDIAADERAFAERVIATIGENRDLDGSEKLLYARVDMVRDSEGTLRVMELELIEPSLFLVQSGPALERFAAAIAARCAAQPA